MTEQGRLVGEFATPVHVAALMLDLADPQPGHKVYDPCFGFGELLVGAARRLRAAARTSPLPMWAEVRQAGIFGVEIDPLAYAVGLCRTLLAGIDHPRLELTDALERPLPRNRSAGGFDRILATPPWGARTARTSTGQFRFPSRNAETLFLQHVMANLRPGGRAVVALPEGPLYRLGSDRRVRKTLLSEYSIDAVVSLPAGAFAPWTGIAASLVVFRRDRPQSAVRFIGISPGAWEAAPEAGDHSRTRTELLRGVSDLITRRSEPLSDPLLSDVEAWDVPVCELGHRDYELVPARSGSDALDAEIDRLVAADRTLKVERLERVADVFAGQSYPGRCTIRSRATSDATAGLVRAQDVERIADVQGAARDVAKEARSAKGPVSPLFLTGEGKARVKEREFLRPFDVVVSTVGHAGAVAVFPDSECKHRPGGRGEFEPGQSHRHFGHRGRIHSIGPHQQRGGAARTERHHPAIPGRPAALTCLPELAFGPRARDHYSTPGAPYAAQAPGPRAAGAGAGGGAQGSFDPSRRCDGRACPAALGRFERPGDGLVGNAAGGATRVRKHWRGRSGQTRGACRRRRGNSVPRRPDHKPFRFCIARNRRPAGQRVA